MRDRHFNRDTKKRSTYKVLVHVFHHHVLLFPLKKSVSVFYFIAYEKRMRQKTKQSKKSNKKTLLARHIQARRGGREATKTRSGGERLVVVRGCSGEDARRQESPLRASFCRSFVETHVGGTSSSRQP